MTRGKTKAVPGVVGRIVPEHMVGTREHQLLEELCEGEHYSPAEVARMFERVLGWLGWIDEADMEADE